VFEAVEDVETMGGNGKGMREKWLGNLRPGDEVCGVNVAGECIKLYVTYITINKKIQCDNGVWFDRDGYDEGGRIEPVTDKVRGIWAKNRLIGRIGKANMKVLSVAQLHQILDIVNG